MELVKRILSVMLIFGMLFSSTQLVAFGVAPPTNLDECCERLDKICTAEQKKGIRESNLDDPSNYLREIHDKFLGDIARRWLVKSGRDSKLCELLLEHGLRFDGSMEIGYTGSSVIVENYRHYLLTGKSVDSIEDLIIDHWFYFFHRFDPDFKREKLEKEMERWKYRRDHPGEPCIQHVQSNSWWCTIM